jgi:hypothetical protein
VTPDSKKEGRSDEGLEVKKRNKEWTSDGAIKAPMHEKEQPQQQMNDRTP